MPIPSRNVIVAPDSFKGCLGAAAVATAIGRGIAGARPDLRALPMPLADGGEGLLECLAAAGDCSRCATRVRAIHDRPLTAEWLALADDSAAIESARVLGLPLIGADGPAIHRRGSAALGRLIIAALDAGHRRLLIGLGGSACCDAGLGLLMALGADAKDARGRPVSPDLAGLERLDRLSLDTLDPRLTTAEITVLCDVDNPLTGTRGAAIFYGPQKGLSIAHAEQADADFTRFAAGLGENAAARASEAGSGAAGGLGFALAVLGARLASGADEVMQRLGLMSALEDALAVVTGEGRADAQTLHGKLPAAVAHQARRAGVPAYLVAGDVAAQAACTLASQFAGVLSLTQLAGDPNAARHEAAYWLERAGEGIASGL